MKRLVLISVAVFCAAFALVGHAQNYQDPLADPYLYVPGNDSALLSQWTNIMFDRIRGNDCTPPSAGTNSSLSHILFTNLCFLARNLMMLHVAGLDAAIASRRRFGSNVLASRVAVASAMRTVVSHLYQDTQASVDHVFHYLIQHLIPCQMLDDAIEVGYEAAMDLIARRLRDGSNRFYYYTPKNETCDYWSPTSGKPFWGVQFAVAKPYSMTQHAQFREADFPRAGSEAFAEDLHQVREYGAKVREPISVVPPLNECIFRRARFVPKTNLRLRCTGPMGRRPSPLLVIGTQSHSMFSPGRSLTTSHSSRGAVCSRLSTLLCLTPPSQRGT